MRRLTTVAAFIALAAAPALAQQTPAPPRPTPPRMPAPPGEPRVIRERFLRLDSAAANRATLGMSLAPTGSARDTLGVFVTRVVPGGPAERAGIIEGDRIAAIGDQDLRLAASDVGDAYAAGLPAHRLMRAVGKLSPGASVRMRVYADGRYRNVTATPGRMADVYKGRDGELFLGEMPGMVMPRMEMIGPIVAGSVRNALQAIPPDLDVRIDRALREIPRDVHITLDRAFPPDPDDAPPPPPAVPAHPAHPAPPAPPAEP